MLTLKLDHLFTWCEAAMSNVMLHGVVLGCIYSSTAHAVSDILHSTAEMISNNTTHPIVNTDCPVYQDNIKNTKPPFAGRNTKVLVCLTACIHSPDFH